MKFNSHAALAGAALAAALLAGCSSTPLDNSAAAVESRTPTPVVPPVTASGSNAANTAATPQSRVATVDLAAQNAAAAAAPSQRIVYFDFDSYVIKDEYKSVVDGHAKALLANKGKKLAIEGHTDERGGREYNLALGQKRAESVAKSLTLLGVIDSQVEAVSFGEERPAAPGSDESAWAKNRRAELKDR